MSTTFQLIQESKQSEAVSEETPREAVARKASARPGKVTSASQVSKAILSSGESAQARH